MASSGNESHSTFTFNHPNLGPMTGLVTPDNVVQFRAIPYATLPARFKQSIPLDHLPGGKTDFTKHGFATPHIFGEDIYSGGPRPDTETNASPTAFSEFASHILQVNVPLSTLQSLSSRTPASAPTPAPKLPVMVYIHGGGFVLGKIDENHNAAYMVEHSISTSQPIIGVSIQYRVGALGFLGTPDGGRNFGLRDQRHALFWVQRFVGGFGGDAGRVTAWGESAGSMSVCFAMLMEAPASGPLFHRAIFMSGILGPIAVPVAEGEAERTFERFLEAVGIEERGEEGLEKARGIDVEKINEISDALTDEGGIWLPVEDDLLKMYSWEEIPELLGRCEWVDEIVLGTTGFEGLTMVAALNSIAPSSFTDAMMEKLGEPAASQIAEAYNITPGMDKNLFLTAAMRWMGDVVFDGPTHALAQHLTSSSKSPAKRVYRYVFDVRNPFPNHIYFQQPHHWVDIYFVFRSLQFRYSSNHLTNISDQHASFWIDFANGKAPWTEYTYRGDGQETIMVADDRDGWLERSVQDNERITGLSWSRVEKLYKAWEGVRGARFKPFAIKPLMKKRVV